MKAMSNRIAKNVVKIMVFGTFDGLHKGHVNFFMQAKKLSPNSFLVVSIARDKNVLKIKKKLPHFDEKERKKLVLDCVIVNKVVLGGVSNYISHIKKENPDIIALGYDQKAYVQSLRADLKKNNMKSLVKRLKPYKKHIYKNHLLHKKRYI